MHVPHIRYSSCDSDLLCCWGGIPNEINKPNQRSKQRLTRQQRGREPIRRRHRGSTPLTSPTCQLKLFFTPRRLSASVSSVN